MPSSHLVGGVNRTGDKSRLFSVVLTAFRDWTNNVVIFCHRQSCLARVVLVN